MLQPTSNTLEHQFPFVKSPSKEAKTLLKDMYSHPFWPAKSLETSSIDGTPSSMIHHNSYLSHKNKLIVSYGIYKDNNYGVSSASRVLSPQLLLKKYDYVRKCLADILGLTTAQREVALRLLRLWAYYGQVYPKEAQVTGEPGCRKATYWRTIRILRELGLIHVINRYVIRPHAQISNLYRLDRLVLLLARYISEHGHAFYERWLEPYLAIPGREFWSQIFQAPGDRAGPLIPVFVDP